MTYLSSVHFQEPKHRASSESGSAISVDSSSEDEGKRVPSKTEKQHRDSRSNSWSNQSSDDSAERMIIVDDVKNEAKDIELNGLSELIKSTVMHGSGRWDSGRLDFLLKIFEAYAKSLRTLQVICKELKAELEKKNKTLLDREKQIAELERNAQSARDLCARQLQLSEQEAKLLARQTDFEDKALRRIQDCFRQVASWEEEASAIFRSSMSTSP